MTCFGEFDQSLFTPFFVADIHGLRNPVRKEHDEVAGFISKRRLVDTSAGRAQSPNHRLPGVTPRMRQRRSARLWEGYDPRLHSSCGALPDRTRRKTVLRSD